MIKNNNVHDNYADGILIEQAHNVNVIYNLSYNNSGNTGSAGIEAYRSTGPNQIYNNTIYGNSIGIKSWGDGAGLHQTNNSFKNNISFTNSLFSFSACMGGQNDGTNGSGNVYEYNALGPESSNFIEWAQGVYKSTYAAFDTAYGSSTHSVAGDPYLVAGGDAKPYPYFYPRYYSPVINAGTDVGLTKDYLGRRFCPPGSGSGYRGF